MSPHVGLFWTCVVTEAQNGNKLFSYSGTTLEERSRGKHFASFRRIETRSLVHRRPCCMWLPPCLVSEYVLSTGWNVVCWWLNYSKPPTCPKAETDRSSLAGHFIKSMLFLFMSDSTHKWLTSEATISSINSTANEGDSRRCAASSLFLPVSLSIHLPLSLFSPTSLAFPFSVDKLSETLTTQPGKIARSHAARQVYPWPWFPLTTFPSAPK